MDEELLPVYEKRKKSKESSAARRRRDDGKYIKSSKSLGINTNDNTNELGLVSTETHLVDETKPQSIVEYRRVEKSREEKIAPVFVEAKNFFVDWYEDKEKKICEFDVADYVSLKRIIEKIEKQFVEEKKILDEFKRVFENWNSWDEIYKNKLKFTQIELYWPKIIESIKKNEPEINNLSIAENFENFWNKYDKNIGRITCEKLWLDLTREERMDALNYVPAYVASTPDKQFRSNPQTFLEKKMWFNEIIMPNSNGSKNGSSKKISGSDIISHGKKMWGQGD